MNTEFFFIKTTDNEETPQYLSYYKKNGRTYYSLRKTYTDADHFDKETLKAAFRYLSRSKKFKGMGFVPHSLTNGNFKGTFTLNSERTEVSTDVSMYDCVDCLQNEVKHHIIEIPGPPATGNEVSSKGDPTTIHQCTGCRRWDGPWVPAPY